MISIAEELKRYEEHRVEGPSKRTDGEETPTGARRRERLEVIRENAGKVTVRQLAKLAGTHVPTVYRASRYTV